MAICDWNGNENNEIRDDFTEYPVCYHNTKNNHSTSDINCGVGMSVIRAIVSVVEGFLLQSVLYSALGIDITNVPLAVILVLWVVFSALVAVVIEK